MPSRSVDLQWLLAGTKDPEVPPGSSSPAPPKRGRGRPRGSTKTAAASSAAAASVHPAEVNADTEGQHGAALEPAGPAQDGANVQGPQTRRRRNTSVSQATGAAATGAHNGSSAPDADADTAAAAVPSDVPTSKRGSKMQSEAAKGRSRSASSVSQLKQVRS